MRIQTLLSVHGKKLSATTTYVARILLNDSINIRPGDWRPSMKIMTTLLCLDLGQHRVHTMIMLHRMMSTLTAALPIFHMLRMNILERLLNSAAHVIHVLVNYALNNVKYIG